VRPVLARAPADRVTNVVNRPAVRLSRRHERWLYVMGGLLVVSGVGWLLSHYVLPHHGEFADAPSPAEPWWMRLHGAALIGFLTAFGALLPGHAVRGWRRRMNHRTGMFMIVVVSLLALTGYGLYYVGDETTRPWISIIHWAVGLAATAGLVVHAVLGKRDRKRTRESVPRTP